MLHIYSIHGSYGIEWPEVRARFESIRLTRWSHPTQSAAWNLGPGCHSRTIAQHRLFSVSPRCAALRCVATKTRGPAVWMFLAFHRGHGILWVLRIENAIVAMGRSLAKLRAMQRTGSCNIMHKDAWSIDISIGICLSTQPIPTRKETYCSSQGFLIFLDFLPASLNPQSCIWSSWWLDWTREAREQKCCIQMQIEQGGVM